MHDNDTIQKQQLTITAALAGLTIGLVIIAINWLPSLGLVTPLFEKSGLLGALVYSWLTIYAAFIPAALISGAIFNILHKRGFTIAFFICLPSSAIISMLYVFVFTAGIESTESGLLNNIIIGLIASLLLTVVITHILNFILRKSRLAVIVISIAVCFVSLAMVPIGTQYKDTVQTKELYQQAEESRSFDLYLPGYNLKGYKLVQATPDSSSSLGISGSTESNYKMTYSTHTSWNTTDALYNRYTITQFNGEAYGFEPPDNCAAPNTVGGANRCTFYHKTKHCDLYRSISPNSYLYCKIGKTTIQLHFMPGNASPLGNRGTQITLEPLNPKVDEIQQIFDSLVPSSAQTIQSSVQD